MVVTMVRNAALAAKIRVGSSDKNSLAQHRQIQRWKSHFSRVASAAAHIRSAKAHAWRVYRRQQFLRLHSLKNMDFMVQNKDAMREHGNKRFVNTAFKLNAKMAFKKSADMCKYMSSRGRFPTLIMKQRYVALQRKEHRAFARKQRIAAQQQAKESNRFHSLRVFPCKVIAQIGDYDDVSGPSLIKPKVRQFNDVKQNFVYRSKRLVAPHPYADIKLHDRLHHAIYVKDAKYVGVLIAFKRAVEHTRVARTLQVRRSFRRLILGWADVQRMSLLTSFDNLALTLMAPRAIPEMENNDAHGEGAVTTTTSNNVVLTEARESSGEMIHAIPRWHKLNTEDVIGNYNEMVNRWHVMDQFKWTTAGEAHALLRSYHLPNYVLTCTGDDKKTLKFVNLISIRPFFNHRLWRGDMEIRLDINSNKFQVGQLQCSFYYGFRDMQNYKHYENVYTLSQCSHGLLDAGGSNSVILTIPFKYHSVMLPLSNSGDLNPAYLGTLNIFILNQLKSVEGSPQDADIVINFRFVNNEFSGQIPMNLGSIKAVPEMEAFAVAGAMKLLDQVAADPNRDNPSQVTPPAYLVPTATHTWSGGTGMVDVLHSLRLDTRGQTRHPLGCSVDDFTTIFDLARVWGYADTETWSVAQNTYGAQIVSCGVSADGFREIPPSGKTLARVGLTPLGIVSNMFAQWRGSIEYRFDFVSNQFHTGRLLIAFFPMTKTAGTIDEALSCFNMQFDLAESKSVTMTVPFVCRDAWTRRGRQMDGTSPVTETNGVIAIYVLNHLNCPQSAPQVIDFNIYKRAGPTFEVSVPIQPSIGLGFNNQFIENLQNIYRDNENADGAYIGYWEGEGLTNIPVLRWGVLAGRILTYNISNITNKNVKWYFETEREYSATGTVENRPFTLKTKFFALVTYNGYTIAIPNETVQKAADMQYQSFRSSAWTINALKMENIGSNDMVGGSPIMFRRNHTTHVNPEMERLNTENLINNTIQLRSTNFGREMFGESFNRLLDLCRRYQFYGSFSVDAESLNNGKHVIIQMPIIPGGLPLNLDIKNPSVYIANKCREGIIPLILSAFRFYRGSIRFRIKPLSGYGMDSSFWIQHRPELCSRSDFVIVNEEIDNMNMYAHGYAGYVQTMGVNSVIEFEVPFYQPGMYGILNETSIEALRMYNSNGVVTLGVPIPKSNVIYEVFYSLGDDFTFNTFQGFPVMIDVTGISSIPKIMSTNDGYEFIAHALAEASQNIKCTPQMEEPKREFTWIERTLGLDRIGESISKTMEHTLNDVVQQARNTGWFNMTKEIVSWIIKSVMHFLASPSLRQLIAIIIDGLITLGVSIHDKIKTLSRFIVYFVRRFWPDAFQQHFAEEAATLNEEAEGEITDVTSDPETTDEPEKLKKKFGRKIFKVFGKCRGDKKAKPQFDNLQEDKEIVAGWCSIVYTVINSVMGGKVAGKWRFDCDKLISDFVSAKHIKGGNAFFTFIKFNFAVINKCIKFIQYKICPRLAYSDMFLRKTALNFKWLEEVRDLSSIDLDDARNVNDLLVERVEMAIDAGNKLISATEMIEKKDYIKILNDYEKRLSKLVEMRDKLRMMGKYAFNRPKPLHIQFYGESGIGKSEVVKATAKHVLRKVCKHQSFPPNLVCNITPGAKYWDQCTGSEPVLFFDDLWAYNSVNALDTIICNYIELYGTTVFSPPQAAIEKKSMRYAPHVIMSTTNSPWVVLPGVHAPAIWRRMDMLVEVKKAGLDPEGHPSCPHCRGEDIEIVAKEHLKDNHHILFRIADKRNEKKYLTDFMTWIQFSHQLEVRLNPRWEKNMDAFRSDVEEMQRELRGTQPLHQSFNDRVEAFQAVLRSRHKHIYGEYTASSVIDKAQTEGKQILNNLQANLQERLKLIRATFSRNRLVDVEPELDSVKPEMGEADKVTVKRLVNLNRTYKALIGNGVLHAKEKTAMMGYASTSKKKEEEITMREVMDALTKAEICKHCTEEVMRASFREDTIIMDESRVISIKEKCRDYCILHSTLTKYWAHYFVSRSTLRTTRFLDGDKLYYPHELCYPEVFNNDVETIWSKMKGIYGNILETLTSEEGIFMKTYRFIKGILDWVRGKILYFIPFILLISGGFGIVQTMKGTKQATSKYCKEKLESGEWVVDRDTYEEYVAKQKAMFQPESNHYTNDLSRAPKIIGTQPIPKIVVVQSAPPQVNEAESRYRRNAIWVHMDYEDDSGNACTTKHMCVGIRGKQLLILKHYWETWKEHPTARFTISYVTDTKRIIGNNSNSMVVNILDCNVYSLSYEEDALGNPLNDCNWMVIDMPEKMQALKDLTKFFARRADHTAVGPTIIFARPGESSVELQVQRNPNLITMEAVPGGRELGLRETYLYKKSQPGFCGTAILAPTLQRPIIGIHVAGWSGLGVAEPIYGEAFDLEPTPERPVVDVCEMPLLDVDFSKIDIDTIIYPQGCVEPKFARSQMETTQYEKTIFHGEIMPVTTEPMPLSKNDPRSQGVDPMVAGVRKHGLLSKDFPREMVEKAREDLREKLVVKCPPVIENVGVQSLQVAICGDDKIPAFTPLKWSSSEGFPMVVTRPAGTKGKRYLFKMDQTNEGMKLTGLDPEFNRLYTQQMACRKRGIRPDTVYIDCLKDEVRSREKANTPGKTRVFSTAPVQYIVAFRQYYGDFMAAYRSNRIQTEHGIGINVDGPEWGELALYLQKQGKSIIAGDYSHFGYTLNSDIMKAAFDIMLAWYDRYSTSVTHREDQIVRGVLASEAINVKRLCRNYVYQSPCGMASGFPATDILNSMVNCMYIRLAWMGITREPLTRFNENCNAITYGDDLLINVSDKYIDQYNTQTMYEYFDQYDIKFTDCDKSGKIVARRTLENAPFLKRNFIEHPDRPMQYLARIEEESIGSCLNWAIKQNNPVDAMISNARSALTLAYGHGPSYYNALRKQLKEAFVPYGVQLHCLDWREYDNEAYTDAK